MEQQARVRVSEKGRVVIPASIRKELGIKVGDIVDLRVVDKELRVSTLKARIERAQERVRKYAVPGKLMSDELIAERREEARREESANE
jgi:AbrB family looped-hinge helix DNA binding protein